MSSTTPRREKALLTNGRLLSGVVALLLVVAAVALTGSSSASFTSRTGSTGSVSSAADWTAPTVSVTAPSSPLKGTVSIAATAADTGSGIAAVNIQRAPAGSSDWTSLCITGTSPFACDWDTTQLADGAYDLRAIAVDRAANSTTSAVVRATVANNVTVVLARPGDLLRGSVTTTTTVTGLAGVTPTVRVEYAPTGTTTWKTLCTAAASPFTCSADTATLADGTYDLRSVAVVGTTSYTSAVVTKVVVDNVGPTVTMTDPGSPLKGSPTFTATAKDTQSGIAKVVIQWSTGSDWYNLCIVDTSPYSCTVDTTKELGNGTYSFRAVATDNAGNTTRSATVADRTVQNTSSSVTMTAPPTYLRNGVNLAATATSTGTIASVKFQRSVAGANSWVDICSDSTSPYACAFDTSQVGEGTYDLRAVLTNTDGTTATSAVVTNRIIDKTPGKGVDIQTTNGGTAGKIDAGDTVVYTFSKQMDLSSIYSGWSGAATSGTMRVRAVWFGSDLLDVSSPSGVRLGTVDLGTSFTFLADAYSDVSITAATVTVDGVARTVVTMKVLSASGVQTGTAAKMVWQPASTILDLGGNPVSTAPVTESGTNDLDF